MGICKYVVLGTAWWCHLWASISHHNLPILDSSTYLSTSGFPKNIWKQITWLFPQPRHKFPWPFCNKFYLEHEMIITIFFIWKPQHFLFYNNQHLKKSSLTFWRNKKSSPTFPDHFIFSRFFLLLSRSVGTLHMPWITYLSGQMHFNSFSLIHIHI